MEIQNPFTLKLYIADVFENFLIDIRKANKQVRFVGLTGNHDRPTKQNEADPLRTA
jgi:DNA repair exonuclease SbcCD nuclease subunit